VVESYYTEIQLDHVAWARLLRDKVHRLTLAECKLDTVIAVARALFAHPTIDVAYTRLEIYETDNRDALICSILESGLRAEAWALDPSALDGFTLNVYAARADGDAWYALTKLSA